MDISDAAEVRTANGLFPTANGLYLSLYLSLSLPLSLSQAPTLQTLRTVVSKPAGLCATREEAMCRLMVDEESHAR
jgi:hypothetical protein